MDESWIEVGDREVTRQIIGCAMEVHRALGPGLLETTYRRCLMQELRLTGLRFTHEVPIPIVYKGESLECAFRADIVVDDSVVVELKAVERLHPLHEAQLLTYLKLANLHVGLILNFNATSLKHGIRRLVR